ncbi:hypothetical protein A9P79_27940 (plasmid) [Cupriavidus taiwanensis]|nr:hypothetical protein A9P79_27940 [Cupriavidus taiwanensis]
MESRLHVSVPAINDELVDIHSVQPMFRQNESDFLKVLDFLIALIVLSLLLLDAKNQFPIFYHGDGPVVR